ncbi:MAG: DNA/RNA nuclease SfsA [Pseudomonadota bacterium]
MHLPTPLVKARLIRRYNRFLADATLEDGETVTAHVANPGSMLGLNAPGQTIWLSRNDDPKRKLKYTWELVALEAGHYSGVSTAHPNRIVEEALRAGRIPEFADYPEIRREVKYGKNSRIDFLLSAPDRPDLYLEIKNVHLRREDDWAEFPDSVTARGAKHLAELADMAGAGARAVMLYVVQRTDCARFRLAADLDPAYAAAFRQARARGVEAVCRTCRITVPKRPSVERPAEILLDRALPIEEG